jgi:tetratricopeptide (TPR) repeat protein
MTTEVKKALKLFYCYAREDKTLRDDLDIHLRSLKRQNVVTSWYDGEITPGSEWEKEIDTQLRAAHLILLLVTPHFMASDYCYGIEMEKALQRHRDGTARIIPIILRRTNWEDAPFSTLQVLPPDAKPVIQWPDRDEAFWNITVGIKKAITELQFLLKTPQEWFLEGNTLDDLSRYEEAIAAYDQAIRLDPNNADAYNNKGVDLYDLKRYEEAIVAYDQAIRLDPNNADAYYNKGNTLYDLKRYEEAIAACDQAIYLNSNDADAYKNKSIALYDLRRYEEAIAAYDQVIRLNPNDAIAYYNKGIALNNLKRYEEAIGVYDQATRLNPKDADAYNNKGIAFDNLNMPREAQQCYQIANQLRTANKI